MSDRVEEADQSIEYIAHFAKAVELYQKKNKNCFGCGSPNHFVCDCPKDVSRPTQKVFKHRGDGKEGRPKPSEAMCHSVDISG